MIQEYTLEGKVPSKKNRYVYGRGRMYLDSSVTDWLKHTLSSLKSQKNRKKYQIIYTAVSLEIQFLCDNRSDLDNMCNSIFDALQACGIIENDKQIVSLRAYKAVSKEPITYIKLTAQV